MKCCFGKQKKEQLKKQRTQRNEPGQDERESIDESQIILTSVRKRKSKEGGPIPEMNEMRKSKLMESIDIMDFTMDDPEGISHTPSINTFRYDSLLSHAAFSLLPPAD